MNLNNSYCTLNEEQLYSYYRIIKREFYDGFFYSNIVKRINASINAFFFVLFAFICNYTVACNYFDMQIISL